MQKPAAILLLSAAALLGADYAAEGRLWWAHIQFLADDKLEGRNTGSEGFRQAVAYVARQFDKIGLKPAGTSGYLQPVKFQTRELLAAESGLSLVREGKAELLAPGQEATLTGRGEMEGTLEAPMVFVGYGMAIPEVHHDELAGLDLKGKDRGLCQRLRAGGSIRQSEVALWSGVERWAALKKAGAIGVATITEPSGTESQSRISRPLRRRAAGRRDAGRQAGAGRRRRSSWLIRSCRRRQARKSR